MQYPGGKGGEGVVQAIINQMPPHKVYVELFAGGGAVLKAKEPATRSYAVEIDPSVAARWTGGEIPGLAVILGDAFEFVDWLVNRSLVEFEPAETLIYADPPYLGSVRSSPGDIYTHEMKDEASHRRLLDLFRVLTTLGFPVIVSGYQSALYDEMLPDWRKTTFTGVTRGGARTETLWMNFPEPSELHDYRFLGANYREREYIKRQKQRWTARLAAMSPQRRQALTEAIREFEAARSGTVTNGDKISA